MKAAPFVVMIATSAWASTSRRTASTAVVKKPWAPSQPSRSRSIHALRALAKASLSSASDVLNSSSRRSKGKAADMYVKLSWYHDEAFVACKSERSDL